jgi:hypothetical protein
MLGSAFLLQKGFSHECVKSQAVSQQILKIKSIFISFLRILLCLARSGDGKSFLLDAPGKKFRANVEMQLAEH